VSLILTCVWREQFISDIALREIPVLYENLRFVTIEVVPMNISLLFGMQVGGLRKGAFSHLGKDTWDVIN